MSDKLQINDDANKLRTLADWFDANDAKNGNIGMNEVQTSLREIADRIESTISERDGWIDVSDPPKEDGSYLMLFGFTKPFMHVCHYYTSIGFGPETRKWQPLPPIPPLPSAPKQPKK